MRPFATTVEIDIAAPAAEAFAVIVPIKLDLIFKGYGFLPGVAGAQNQTGAWDAAGQTRTVLFSDGSPAYEELKQYDRGRHFAYTVGSVTGPLRFLVSGAAGE